jgi:hypothetical protein
MELEAQVPSSKICQAIAAKALKLATALVWVKDYPMTAEPYVVTRNEYENSEDLEYLCDAPTETEMKQAILAKDYKQYVWLKCSLALDGYAYALEYEDAYRVVEIAVGEAATAPNALAIIFEEVIV